MLTGAISVEELLKRLDEKKARWRLEIRLGQRVKETIDSVRASEADLVVLTTPRPDPSNVPASWGSFGFRICARRSLSARGKSQTSAPSSSALDSRG